MLVRDLKKLTAVADLLRSDLNAAPLVLAAQNETLLAQYRGAYLSGSRRIPLDGVTPKEFVVALNAIQFRDLVGVLDDETTVQIQQRGGTVRLLSDGFGHGISLQAQYGDELWDEDRSTEAEFSLYGDVNVLISELTIASEFSSRSMANPILNGIRIGAKDNKVTLFASDGVGEVFASSFPFGTTGSGSVVVAALDLLLGLKLSSEREAQVSKVGNRLVLTSESTYFYTTTYDGAWPDYSALAKPVERTTLIIPSTAIKMLVAAATTLHANTDLILTQVKGGVALKTIDSDVGQVVIRIDGTLVGTYRYDVGVLGLAAKLGDTLTFQIPQAMTIPTLITVGNRRLWISGKYA